MRRLLLTLMLAAAGALIVLTAPVAASTHAPAARLAPAATTTVYDWGWENPLPQGNALNGVSCPTATLCKAVGDGGTILSWNGTTWSADGSGTGNNLLAASSPTATLCKAVGDGGAILS